MAMKERPIMLHSGVLYQRGYARVIAWIRSIVNALFANRPLAPAEAAEQLEFATARAAQLFTQARLEDSNLELDWLWYAANMRTAAERRYCLHRALAINPQSYLARSALAKLPKLSSPAGEVSYR
jgi:hypothetical protein